MYEIWRYNLTAGKSSAEFYDDVPTSRAVAQALVEALREANPAYWYYVKNAELPRLRNWEQTGHYMTHEDPKEKETEPVGDPLYDSLKAILSPT